MKINYIKASNFLSFGSEPLFIDFTKLGNIVCVRGENKDHGEGASNGAGKSTIIEAIVYAFYGKLVKNLSHSEAINIKSKKKLEVEVGFEMDGHTYVIVRRRKPDDLLLYVDGVEEKLGGMPATQDAINKIIRLNYNAFVNIVCFGQHNAKPFLMCTAGEKRQIAESLLSLDKYNKYCEAAKSKKKVLLQKLEVAAAVYERSKIAVTSAEGQIARIERQREDWRVTQLNAIERLRVSISRAKDEMTGIHPGSASSYESVSAVEGEISDKGLRRQSMRDAISQAETKQSQLKEARQNIMLTCKELNYAITRNDRDIQEMKEQAKSLVNSDGTKCKVCFGIINKANFKQVLSHNEKHIADLKTENEGKSSQLEKAKEKMTRCDEAIGKINKVMEETKLNELSIGRTIRELEVKRAQLSASFQKNADAAALIIEQKIVTLSDQLTQKEEELRAGDPYGPILEGLRTELEENKEKAQKYREEADGYTAQIPYYDFWIGGFGDKGIRSFVIDEIVPLLNAKINYWLQFLIDNKITLKFDNELVETIERNPPDGDPFVHQAMSGGEHQCISLGISQGFANVTALTADSCPNIVCLDEVGTNLDRPRIQCVYNMICELARDRQVLVISHDPDLLEMLAGQSTVTVVKEKGLSRIK